MNKANKACFIVSEPIEINLEEKLKAYNSNNDLVEEVLLRKIILNIDESSNETFAFLRGIDVFINTDKFGKVKIASVSDIEESNIGKELEIDVDKELDLAKFMKQEFITLEVSGFAKEGIEEEVLIKADLTYWVDFKVLGN